MVKRRRTTTTENGRKTDSQNGMTVSVDNAVSESKQVKSSINTPVEQNYHETRSTTKSLSKSPVQASAANGNAVEEQNVVHPPTRTSGRVPKKRVNRDISPQHVSPAKKQVRVKKSTSEAKTRRPWELWSAQDKNTFFEGLYEFGKDFDAIQNFIAQKHKKKGDRPELIKNKDQVRHFYYRTWHKIAKYVDIGDDVKKQTQELYGLINYGELRKRIGGRLDDKKGQRLTELVLKGTTLLKVKGKNLRLKTPMCQALKKLNNIEDHKEQEEDQPKVPEKVAIELRPRNNAAWSHVQSMSQNPRLRMNVSANRRLSTVIEYLQKKWKSPRVQAKEKLNVFDEPEKTIRLLPTADCVITPVTLTHTEPPVTGLDLAFENYKETLAGPSNSNSPLVKKNQQKSPDFQSDDSNQGKSVNNVYKDNQKAANDQNEVVMETAENVAIATTSDKPESSENGIFKCNNQSSLPLTFGAAMATGSAAFETSKITKETVTKETIAKETVAKETDATNNDVNAANDELVQKIRQGWTAEDAEMLTFAQLFLMLGSSDRIVLEYEWCDKIDDGTKTLANMLRRLIQLATSEFADVSKSKQHIGTSSPNQNSTPPSSKGRSPSVRGHVGRSPSTAKMVTKQTQTAPLRTTKEDDSLVFRKPDVPLRAPVKVSPNTLAETKQFMQQLHSLSKPDHRLGNSRLKNRVVRKPLVVQRTLLPKAQMPTRQIMGISMVPQTSQVSGTGSFMPVLPSSPSGLGQSISPTNINQTITSTTGGTQTVAMTTTTQTGLTNPIALAAVAAGVTQPIIAGTLAVQPVTVTEAVSKATAETVTKAATLRRIAPAPVPPGTKTGLLTSSPVTVQPVQGSPSMVKIVPTDPASPMTLSSSPANSPNPTKIPKAPVSMATNSNPTLKAMLATGGAQQNSVSTLTTTTTMMTSVSDFSQLGIDVSSAPSSATPSLMSPTPSMSSFLDISLPEAPTVSDSADRLIELALGNASSSFTDHRPSTPPPSDRGSPFKLSSPEKWLGGESMDFSLGSFLSDSPMKDKNSTASLAIPPPNILCESSRDSTISKFDVDATLHQMMNENSVDYMANFANLAAQIAAGHEPNKEADVTAEGVL